jgi:DNA polymerase-1
LPQWLEMHRAGVVIVDRKTTERKTMFIRRAAVSVTGGIQPDVLKRALTPEFLEAGLGARLLLAMPPRLPKRWGEAEVDPEVERAYRDAIDRLLALDFNAREGDPAPHAVHLSWDAKTAWVAFFNQWGEEQAAAEGELAAVFSKLEGYAARFALLHHVVGRVARGEDDLVRVGRESVEAGASLARWFAGEARRIYSTLSESTEQQATRRLVEFIRARGGRITVRQVMRSNNRRYPDAETAEAALDDLVKSGALAQVESPAGKSGETGKAFELCVTHDTHDTGPEDDGGGGVEVHDSPGDSSPGGGLSPPDVMPAEAACDRVTPVTDPGVMRVMRHAGARETAREEKAPEVGPDAGEPAAHPGVMPPARLDEGGAASGPSYSLVTDGAGLAAVAAAVLGGGVVGVDLETTGLDPRRDRARLLSLALDTIDGGPFVYLIDLFRVDCAPLLEALAGKEVVAHNALFDLGFLDGLGFAPRAPVHCTMTLSRVLHAGERAGHGLKECLERELAVGIDKGMQKADWSGNLTPGHLGYAARDALHLRPLLDALRKKAAEAGLGRTVEIETGCLPAVAWMSCSGVAVDRAVWLALAGKAEADAARLREGMAALAPPQPGEMFPAWNWDSPADMRALFAALGHAVDDTGDATLATLDHPLAPMLREYREATKRTGTYGLAWTKHISADGRVYPRWNQAGSEAGRMSCSNPNMQQLPRDKAYRRCVVAPPGRVLIKADFSQIELRIAAKVSGDEALLDAYTKGADVHSQTARRVLGKQDVSREDRQLAKALNFGLLYGMGAERFRENATAEYRLDLSAEQAGRYRDAFFRAYPGLRDWHRSVGRTADAAIDTRTLAGRRRLGVARYTEKLNTPVQGTGADGLKLALALLWERREQCLGAFPVLAVHDEIVVEADEAQADAASV